jgi:hypothetical protein
MAGRRGLLLARAALAGVCLALLATAAGCGGGGGAKPLSKAAYDRQMEALGREISASLTPLATVKTAPEAAAAASRLRKGLRTVEARLAAINPPAAVKDDHAKLVTAVGKFATELGPVITRLEHGDLSAAGTVYTLPAVAEVQAASGAIEAAGYPIAG